MRLLSSQAPVFPSRPHPLRALQTVLLKHIVPSPPLPQIFPALSLLSDGKLEMRKQRRSVVKPFTQGHPAKQQQKIKTNTGVLTP